MKLMELHNSRFNEKYQPSPGTCMTFDELEARVKVDRAIEGMSNSQKYKTVKDLVEKGEKDTRLYDPFMLGVFDWLVIKIQPTPEYSAEELKAMFKKHVKPKDQDTPKDPRVEDPEYTHGYNYAKKVYKKPITIGDIQDNGIKSGLRDLLCNYVNSDVISSCIEECLQVINKFA